MSFTDDLVTGVAVHLAANVDPAQNLTWQPVGTYPAGKTGIYIGAVPSTPDRVVVLTPFPLSDDATLSDSTVGLQVRSRSVAADMRDVTAIDDAIFDALAGNFPLDLTTGVRITTLVRSSAVSLGQDDQQRWEWVSNYTAGVWRPSTHRT